MPSMDQPEPSTPSRRRSPRVAVGAAVAAALVGLLALSAFRLLRPKLSELARYSGFSHPEYDDWVRTSRYIDVRDGTKLAVDVYRPTHGGSLHTRPLPALWTHERYQRAKLADGEVTSAVTRLARLQKFLRHGYTVVIASVRGGGASFGTRRGPFTPEEAADAFDVTEWIAEQAWCDGNVGMFGRSYGGVTQYFAASRAPPHLKAIFPAMALFDLYSFAYSGGILRDDFVTQWSELVERLDTVVPAVPVGGDDDGRLLAKARAEHRNNDTAHRLFSELLFRDSPDPRTGELLYETRSPSSVVADINRSGVAVYHLSGWLDLWCRDALLWYANLQCPQKIVIGPWSHTDTARFSLFAEQLRWFDYWLKGVPNGIMDDAPVHYCVMGAPAGTEWRAAESWPPESDRTPLYLAPGPSGSVASVNDGILDRNARTSDGSDDYIADYDATSGRSSRWANGYGRPFSRSDRTGDDEGALTYTTPPLDESIEVTGHPIVRLWVTCSEPDVDLVLYLEEVDSEGRSIYITEGSIRASHRVLSDPPYDNLGLPYHAGLATQVRPLSSQPEELVCDLLPTSNVFDAGHRIRLTVTCADRDNLRALQASPPAVLTIHRGPDRASHLSLPVIRRQRPDEGCVVRAGPDPAWLASGVLSGLALLVLGFAFFPGRRGSFTVSRTRGR